MPFDVNKFSLLGLAIVACTLLSPSTGVFADEGPVGTWKLNGDLSGYAIDSTLVVSQADNDLTVKMDGMLGEGEVGDVTFADGVLKFDLTLEKAGGPVPLHFSGKINGDLLEGSLDSDFGEYPVTGKRAATPQSVVGTWKLALQFGGNQMEPNLIVTKAGSGLKAELGGESKWGTVENVQFSDGVLKFDVTTDKGPLSFSGNVKGDQLEGVFESDFGEIPVTGKRAPKQSIVGRWKFATELSGTPIESTLIVAKADDGLKAKMEGALATGNVDNVTFSDSVLKFDVTFQKAAGPSTLRFSVKVNGDQLEGSFDSDFGKSPVTGKLEDAK